MSIWEKTQLLQIHQFRAEISPVLPKSCHHQGNQTMKN